MYKNPNNPEMEKDINERIALNGSLELSMAEYIGDALFNAIPQDHKAIAAQLLLISKIKQNCLKSSYSESELLGKTAVIKLGRQLAEVVVKYIKDIPGYEEIIDKIIAEIKLSIMECKNE